MITQQSGVWGISIYFDPSININFAVAGMTNWWEARFTFYISTRITTTSTPVGTASNAPVTFFIPFVGYIYEKPSLAIIIDVETRGDLDDPAENIALRVRVSLHFNTSSN